jgi:6-phosphogluconolactonase
MAAHRSISAYGSRTQAIDAAVTRLEAVLEAAVASHRRASLGVCGGRTAAALLPVLAQRALDWSLIDVFLVDERWVPVDSDDSNEKLVRNSLLHGSAAAARFFGLKSAHAQAITALDEVEQRLGQIATPFDAVFLGMGDDGHVASLFPAGAENQEYNRLIVASTAPVPPYERISLSPGALGQARHVVIPVMGAAKRAVLDRALRAGPVDEFPVRHVLASDTLCCEIFAAP